jgi:predicted ArsR family transcriptional regulator
MIQSLDTLSNSRLGFLIRLSQLDVRRTTHGAIAESMGLSVFAVRTALKDIEAGGFITVISSPQGVSIAIDKSIKRLVDDLSSN